MGYQEKRVWILFATQAVLYSVYFWMLHHRNIHLVGTLYLILAIIVAQVVLQILLSVTSSPERRDERDRAIESRAYRVAYIVQVVCLVFTMGAIAHHIGFSNVPTAATVINTLLFGMAVAELAKLATQITLYRRTA